MKDLVQARDISRGNAARAAIVFASFIAVALVLGAGSLRAAGTFAPTVTMQLSTTRAAAHPDARITIDNSASSENIKSMTMKLPNGLWGSMAAATKCAYATAQAGNCTNASKIGTVSASATIDDSESLLRGKVYLTEPAPANVNSDPAGITVVVPAVVGNVDLGNVIVNARVAVRNAPLPTAPAGQLGQVEGVNTTVDDVPESITDTHNRTVSFHLQSMNIDLTSDLDGPKPPLLTNPSLCSSIAISASFTSYESSTANATDAAPETITGCSGLQFNPVFNSALTDPTAGTNSGMNTDITFPANSPSAKSVSVRLPSFIKANYASFGQSVDMCNPGVLYTVGTYTTFMPDSASTPCPAQAKVGTVTLDTPLLPDPVSGDVYLIDKSPLPWLGIDINPNISGNPKGVTIRLVGTTNTPQLDSTCDELTAVFGSCQSQVSATFSNLPDAPATKMSIALNGPDRSGVPAVPGDPPTTLSGKILTVAAANDNMCSGHDEFSSTIVSNAGSTVKADQVFTQDITGCNTRDVEIPTGGSSPVGTATTDRTPDIDFEGHNGNESGPFQCFIDSESGIDACDSPFTPASNLSFANHRVYVQGGSGFATRAFTVKPAPVTPDTTAPVTSLSTTPTTVDSAQETFDFTANETSDFQCAINPGESISTAFLPCSSTPGTSGSYDATGLLAGLTYTFAVRAQDAAGNVDLTPEVVTFEVDIPFDPTFAVDLSTDVARAHPDMDVTVENPSHEDVKDLTFSLPDGFFGGLTGVGSLCSIADADAGNCPASSQVGTVDATAAVDESTIRNSGTVYLTEPRDPATEPASLSILIHPGIQDVVFDDIIVNASLKIRGVAQGIDTFALDLPNSATNSIDGTTEIDLRKMVLKLRTGTGATYPLLTNPSFCGAMAFSADFTGYGNSEQSANQPFQATGCAGLPFAPALGITAVNMDTGRPAGASTNIKRVALDLNASLSSDPNGAGIKNVTLAMPPPITIDVQKLPAACSLEQAAAKACPASTQIGTASATSPLLKEAVTGNVYMLKSDTPTGLPRLLVALRGRINVDITATNRTINNQIVSTFDTLPDVPLSTFAIRIANFLTTRNNTCDWGRSDWNITGQMTGFNDKASAIAIPMEFDCPNVDNATVSGVKVRNKGKKSTLSLTARAKLGLKLKKVLVTLPKGMKLDRKVFKNKRRLAKLVVITGDGKKLKTKCFKRRSPSVLEINLCKKKYSTVKVTLKAGSILGGKKKVKPSRVKLKVTSSDGRTTRAVQIP